MTSKAKAILGVSRVPFLLLPVVLVAVGAAASAWDGAFSLRETIVALVGLVFAHVGVNVLNEASDMQTGIDLLTERTPFSGGSGTLPGGELSVGAAYAWGILAVGIAAVVGTYFLMAIGTPLVPILLIGLVGVVGYTHVLARIGLGEFFAGLGLGALPVIGTALVQGGGVGPAALAASVPAFLMTFNLLLLNEFPDAEADRTGGRRHLVLLLGRARAARLYALAVVLTPLSIAGTVLYGHLPPWALFACLPTLLGVRGLRWALGNPEETRLPVAAQAGNVAWNLATNAVLAAALAVATGLA